MPMPYGFPAERRLEESVNWDLYEYQLVRIHKETKERQVINMTPAVCGRMQVDENEWKPEFPVVPPAPAPRLKRTKSA